MENNKKIKYVLVGLLAFLWWSFSFYVEHFSFQLEERTTHIGWYISSKIVLYFVLFLGCNFLYTAICECCSLSKERHFFKVFRQKIAVGTVGYAIPVLGVLFFVWSYRGFYSNYEESFITESAMNYDMMNGVFHYITPLLHMVARMIAPGKYSVIVIKIVIFGFVSGYCIARINKTWNTYAAVLLYLFLFMPPSLSHGYSIHRCPTYGMVYFGLFTKLICDWKERKKYKVVELGLLSAVIAALTQWRSEGIYFLVLGPFLLMLTYRIPLTKKSCVSILLLQLTLQAVIWYPQAQITTMSQKYYNEKRSQPFYDYVLTGMIRNGLDQKKNAEALDICNRFIDIKTIEALNDFYGRHAYDEGYASYGDTEFYALRENTSDEQLLEYESTVRKIILRNPWIFIKTQIGGFHHISTHYEAFCLSAVFGNLWVVAGWIVGLWIWAIWKKERFFTIATSCPLIHASITTVMLPAAYIKYYYPEYMFAAITFVYFLCRFLANRCGHNRRAEEK